VKIVLVGAASRSFGRGQIADILRAEELKGRGVTLSLVDVDAKALDLMTRVARRMKEHTGSDVAIESTTDLRAALPGADYVIVAVARRRYELWEQDFRIPLSYGFAHCMGENGGPGALFHALRSLELVVPICRDVEELCPDALVLNFTNPEARVLHAICHLTKVKAAGICHGIFTALEKLSEYVGKPVEDLDVISAGMNHFYCLLRAKDRATGEDLLPRVIEMAADDPSPAVSPLFKSFARIFDVFTFPSEDHIGEYVSFGSEFHGTKWDFGIEKRKVGLADEPAPDLLAEYADGRRPADDADVLAPSGEQTVPIICDVELDRGAFRPAVNVLNSERYIENLPHDAVVEIPGRVDAGGIHPLHVGAIPEAFAAIMRPHFTIHSLATEAYRARSRKLLLQALLLDPNVDSVTRAERMLDEMLELQSEFLPEFE
jgi:alpha-galactosidase